MQYDDGGFHRGDNAYVVQSCAKVADIANRNNPGTLPFFHQYVLRRPRAMDDEKAEIFLDCLIHGTGLSPRSPCVTTTLLAERFIPVMASQGIAHRQIRIQKLATAQADPSGSGWFSDHGVPGNPGHPTFSVEHVMSDGMEIELGEFGFAIDRSYSGSDIGIERAAMALSGKLAHWGDTLAAFTSAATAQAGASGAALPTGFYKNLGQTVPPRA